MCAATNVQTEEELLRECTDNFYLTATLQGRLAYLIMSIHAVNPGIIASFTSYDPTHILFSNMIYGLGVHLFSRPSMRLIGFLHRFSFSILGSMMFNYSSMQVYQYLTERLINRPYLLTFLGFLCGRIMMVHMLAFLYHMDTRSVLGHAILRDSTYETMYG